MPQNAAGIVMTGMQNARNKRFSAISSQKWLKKMKKNRLIPSFGGGPVTPCSGGECLYLKKPAKSVFIRTSEKDVIFMKEYSTPGKLLQIQLVHIYYKWCTFIQIQQM
jgi:hypothetical protein